MSQAEHRIDILPCDERVEVRVGDTVVAASERTLRLEETRCPTRYYFPQADVRMDLLRASATSTHCPYKGDASYWTLQLDGSHTEDVAWAYLDPIAEGEPIRGHLAFYAGRVDELRVGGEIVAGARAAGR